MDKIVLPEVKMLQLLSDFVPQTSYCGFALNSLGTSEFRPQTPTFDPQQKFLKSSNDVWLS